VAALLVAGAVTMSAPADASGSFTSSTTMHAAMSANGKRLVLSATVTAGLGSPSGSIAFVDNHHRVLRVVKLSGCSDTCTVVRRLKVSSLGRRLSSITAAYSGNSALKSSAAATSVLYMRCAAASCAETIGGGQTSVGVELAKGQSALATLGGAALPCSIRAGQVVNLATAGRQGNIQVVLYEAGNAGSAYVDVDNSTFDSNAGHSAYRCMVSSTPFTGFAPSGSTSFSQTTSDFARYGTSPKLSSGHHRGDYVGLIPDCFYLATHSHTSTGVCENLPKLTGPLPDQVLVTLSGGNRVSHFVG
jgi:hypothetical protein